MLIPLLPAPQSPPQTEIAPSNPTSVLPSLPSRVDFGSFQKLVSDVASWVLESSRIWTYQAQVAYGSFTRAVNNFEIIPEVHASITRVQGNARGEWSSGSSFTVTLTSTPTSGNILILTASIRADDGASTSINSITSTNVTWSKAVEKNGNVSGSAWFNDSIWEGIVNSSGAGTTVTVTLNRTPVSNADGVANICEYSGLGSAIVDKTAFNNGNSANPDTGTTATTTQANELWIGSTTINENQSTPTNSFTLLDGAKNVNIGNGYLERIASSTGAANSSTTATSDIWFGVIATFKAGSNVFASDSQALVDTFSKGTAPTVSKETGTLTDVLSRLRNIPESWTDPLTLTDSLGFKYVGKRTLTDTLSLVESLIKGTTPKLTVEAQSLVDMLAHTVGKNPSETLTLVDALTRLRNVPKTLQETLNLIDSLRINACKNLAETNLLTDGALRLYVAQRQNMESVTFTDAITKTVVMPLLEAVIFIDNVLTQYGQNRALTDTLNIADALSIAACKFVP